MQGTYKVEDEQFFVFRDQAPVKPHDIWTVLNNALRKLNLNPAAYSVHSLCSGRASQLIKLGYPIETVKRLGRWRSNAVYKYIKL